MKILSTVGTYVGNVVYENENIDNMKELVEEAVRKNVSLKLADLEKADLRGANLQCADLRGADLSDANLEYARL
jgi:uncharacterized protein YjbI with pentapeptide repeats